jgi:hypothetical protein
VNLFKDINLPGGNVGEWRGLVGGTTWEALAEAEAVDLPCTPEMPFIPPAKYNEPINTPWSQSQLDAFRLTESGVTVIWEGADPKLM